MEWIDVKKQRPKNKQTILVCDMHGDFVTMGRYFEDEDMFMLMNAENLEPDSYPTHWMPIPEPIRMSDV